MLMAKAVALVVAAGRGHRMGEGLPKQYRDLAGRPVLRHTLATLAANPSIAAIRAVIHPDDRALYDQAAKGLSLLDPVYGGRTRQESVFLGLESLGVLTPDFVLVHDGARPFVDCGTVSRVLAALEHNPCAVPALPIVDTLKRSQVGGIAAGTVDRTGLWRAQTPQGFRYADIMAAHRAHSGRELTDDAAVAEAAGLTVALVDGDEDNVKITTNADLERARRHFSAPPGFRVGMGMDVHAFSSAGDGVWLGGVLIAHDRVLEGHSDADVALHAITDAILGAIAAGDIGHHFPPSDLRWKGMSSDHFLTHAGALLSALGGAIVHIDLTVICERPRVSPHRERIRARIADILGIGESRVSVKATTTEGLGFTGRREGIAAQAVATVTVPG
jgi:2-C-methyl-D-erythritol 4-phosphate cytidylyltransferase/2-C-methyl-D-erythritol 2,4-cyclodiphosphate synthase